MATALQNQTRFVAGGTARGGNRYPEHRQPGDRAKR